MEPSRKVGAQKHRRWAVVANGFAAGSLVRPDRFERPTLWFEAKCSIQLSYGRTIDYRMAE